MLDLMSKPAVVPSTPKMVNGINVTALREAIDGLSLDSGARASTWKIRSRWTGGTRSDHLVEGCTIGGEEIHRPFTIRIDEPLELGGTNQFANPQEYLLSAMNACMMVGYATVAALMGIRLTKLEVETTGDIDLRGFLGVRQDGPAGYGKLEQVVRIAGSATDEQFAKLHETVLTTSPNFFNLTRAIPTNSQMEIVR